MKMQSQTGKILSLAAAGVLVFVCVSAILLQVLPGPHRPTDYLVAGAVATFATLLVLFTVLITSLIKTPDVFFKKRKAADSSPTAEAPEQTSEETAPRSSPEEQPPAV